ncbi:MULTISPECIES: hypothetical protein [Staphylococcus]|uniref:hypothetical protein n=1 Tax=Staphylococcus TaxID=1279 RepID=UPI0005821139|nr:MULTISPECIES: hypothetical protein [Staphylococcus]AJC95761.1 hypothetical protein SHYC_05010 [Staphylococcus hyicus]MDG4943959.1 hypothetical protein [Staphylococcus agnetis]MDP4468696.1 hypothetical protein [Staphylococcus hyicus]SQE47258.1 Uncharacterised protein [Staphylococcus hyicus]
MKDIKYLSTETLKRKASALSKKIDIAECDGYYNLLDESKQELNKVLTELETR